MKSKDDNPKTRDRQGGNRYFIDNAFLKTWGAKLGPHCIAVYNVLVMCANADDQTAFPSFQTIADMTGMSRRQAVREIDKLKANNIIRVDRRPQTHPDTGKPYFLTDIFTLLHPDEWVKTRDESLYEPSDTQSPGVGTDSHQPSDTQSPPLVTQSHPNNIVVLHDKPLPTFEILYNRWLDNNLGELKPRQIEMFGDYYDEHPAWVADIMDMTIGGKPTNPWQYFVKIINSWVKNGRPAEQPATEGRPRHEGPGRSNSPPTVPLVRNGKSPPKNEALYEQLKAEALQRGK